MQLHIEPDLAIPFPEDNPVLANFIEKAQAACNSAELLGLDTTPSEEEKEIAENAVYQVAANPDKANKKLAKSSPKMTPAVYKTVDGILKDYSHRVVENAMQIRLLVTNKLIMESEHEDPNQTPFLRTAREDYGCRTFHRKIRSYYHAPLFTRACHFSTS